MSWTRKENGREHTSELHRGAISLAPAGQFPPHFWEEPLECLDLLFHREFLARIAETRLNGEDPELRFVAYDTDPTIEHLILALIKNSGPAIPNGALFGECVGAALALSLIRRFFDKRSGYSDLYEGSEWKALKRVLDFIDAHLVEDLALHRIASIAHISPYHFNKLFKISIGQSVNQYVESERIKRARWLLRNRTLSAKEIAFACGFTVKVISPRHSGRRLE